MCLEKEKTKQKQIENSIIDEILVMIEDRIKNCFINYFICIDKKKIIYVNEEYKNEEKDKILLEFYNLYKQIEDKFDYERKSNYIK